MTVKKNNYFFANLIPPHEGIQKKTFKKIRFTYKLFFEMTSVFMYLFCRVFKIDHILFHLESVVSEPLLSSV